MTISPPHREPRVFAFDGFRLSSATRQLLRSGEPVHLTPKVFDTLLFLIEHRHRVLSKDELLAALWPGLVVEENNLGQAISKLRQILGEAPGDNRFIATIPGVGYRFVSEVTLLEPADSGDARPDGHENTRVAAGSAPKPIGSPWRVAIAVIAFTAALALLSFWPRAQSDLPRTLAVLPFKPLVAEAADPALEMGVADSLIVNLAAVGSLSVQPVSAIRRFHDLSIDPVAAGRALRVDAVLDGHLQRVGDRLRVSVRLLRVADGHQLWADEFDEQLTGIFAIQQTISTRVVAALALQLDDGARHRLARQSTRSAAAYERYLRGRFYISLAQPQQAIGMFEEAIALDPEYAAAHAGLADILSRLPIATDVASGQPMERARTLAARALQLDPELAGAYAVLGWIGFYHDWDWPRSEAHYRQALALDPSDFSARLGYAHLLSNTGRTAEALHQADLALGLEPLSPLAGALKSQFLFHGGRVGEAREQLETTMETAPGFWIAQLMLGQFHLADGNVKDAIGAFEMAAVSAGSTWLPKALIARAHVMAGDDRPARKLLHSMPLPRVSPAPPYILAMLHLTLDERDAALATLERAHAERDVRMVFLGVDPVWQPLHGEPRFVDLLMRMSLAPMESAARN